MIHCRGAGAVVRWVDLWCRPRGEAAGMEVPETPPPRVKASPRVPPPPNSPPPPPPPPRRPPANSQVGGRAILKDSFSLFCVILLRTRLSVNVHPTFLCFGILCIPQTKSVNTCESHK